MDLFLNFLTPSVKVKNGSLGLTLLFLPAETQCEICYFKMFKKYIYVMDAMWEDDISPQRQNGSEDVDSYRQNGAHGHQLKGTTVLWRQYSK